MSGTYQLIGAEASYYTGKVRAYLRYKGVPFEEVLSTRAVYKTVILPRTGVSYIPVLVSPDDVVVQDTSEILDFLEARFPEPPVYPPTPVQRLVASLFELYADEWLVLPAMHYRWNFPEDNWEFILLEFGGSLHPELPREGQRAAGERAVKPFHGALPFLGITDRTRAAVEAWTLELWAQLSTHFARHPFLLGTRPSLGDFALLGPLYAHLYRDPHPGRLMRERAPAVAAWVERMNAPRPRSGAFVPDDVVPDTLLPILRRMFAEQLPVLIDTAERTAAYVAEHPSGEIPRVIGFHEFRLGDVTEQRAVFPYAVWMFQRALDCYQSLGGADRARADAFLDACGGRAAMQYHVPRRVCRAHNRLVPA